MSSSKSKKRTNSRSKKSSDSSSSSSSSSNKKPKKSTTKKSSTEPKTLLQKEFPALAKLIRNEKNHISETEGKSLEQILGHKDFKEVKVMPEKEVLTEIEQVFVQAAFSILQGKGLQFSLPSRSKNNQEYVPEVNRLVLKTTVETMMKRNFAHSSESQKTAIMTRVLDLVYHVLKQGIHVTKRDLFYSDVNLFKNQRQSDSMLDDVAVMLGCTRSSLHVVASEKGVVIGQLKFVEAGDVIDCTKMGVGAKGIPPHLDKVTNIQSDAEFILLVEKDAAFMRLAEDRFYNKYKCIIITAKGQPDVASRMFLKRLKMELKIPVLALVDSDPYGLKILSVYMSGSKNMSYDSGSMSTPDIKWLGVLPSDLDKYEIPDDCRIPMTQADIKQCDDLMKEEFVSNNKSWIKQLKIMKRTKQKAEIQALSTFGFKYLTDVYLPRKLKEGDWV